MTLPDSKMSVRKFALPVLGAALFCFLLIGLSGEARSEKLVTGISDDTIAIESNFVGAELVLFGSIERDANTVARRRGYDIVVVVSGPTHDVVVRKKEWLAGIWVNRRSHRYENVPSYLAVLSNRPLNEITTPETLEHYRLGLVQMGLGNENEPARSRTTRFAGFDAALIRLMRERELYVEDGSGLEFLSNILFSARITVPAYVPVGIFQAEVFLFGDRALLQRQTIMLDVHKSGFEQTAYALATQQSLIYGLLAVAMAVFAGWFASVVFRKD